jgi:serine/threonine-protein kinase
MCVELAPEKSGRPGWHEHCLESQPMIEVGHTVGNYRITAKLGEGGMGVVFLGEHPVIGRRAALKAIHPEFGLNPEVISRFVNEAKAISQIGHEHIVDVTDFGRTTEGDFYFIMEHLQGQTLAEATQRGGAMPPARALDIAAQIADALGASHAHGVVHRDLKPENVFLIARGGTRDFVKVLDFGLAKLATEEGATKEPRAAMIMGTPYFMAPEQCEGRTDVDGRVDVYALGVILFEMLTGFLPFGGETSREILVKQVTMRPPAARRHVPGLPHELDAIIERALAKDPADRFPTMEEFRAALLGAAAQLALSKHPSSARSLVRSDEGPGAARRGRARTTFGEGAGAFASTPGVELTPARDRGRLWLAGAGVAAALVVLFAGRGATSPTVVAARSVVVAPSAPPVRLTFGSDPPGAEIVAEDGHTVGTTPTTIERPASDAPVRYVLRKGGRLPKTISLIPNVSSPLFLTLDPAPTSDPPGERVAMRPRPRPAPSRRAASPPRLPAPPYEDEVLAPGFR